MTREICGGKCRMCRQGHCSPQPPLEGIQSPGQGCLYGTLQRTELPHCQYVIIRNKKMKKEKEKNKQQREQENDKSNCFLPL